LNIADCVRTRLLQLGGLHPAERVLAPGAEAGRVAPRAVPPPGVGHHAPGADARAAVVRVVQVRQPEEVPGLVRRHADGGDVRAGGPVKGSLHVVVEHDGAFVAGKRIPGRAVDVEDDPLVGPDPVVVVGAVGVVPPVLGAVA